MSLISVLHPLDQIDFKLIGVNPGASKKEGAENLYEFLTDEMSKVGGQGSVEASAVGVSIQWEPGPFGGGRDNAQHLYFGHLIQIGVLNDPLMIIANAAYLGKAVDLATVLLTIHSYQLNPSIVVRDSEILSMSTPFLSPTNMTHGIVMLDHGDVIRARDAFEHVVNFWPRNYIAMKYMAICEIEKNPQEAVRWVEKSLELAAEDGMIPGLSERVTYGMSLLAAGVKKEAKKQFDLLGLAMPKMTPKAWSKWGYKVEPTLIAESLADPVKGLFYTKWAERGEDAPYRKPESGGYG